MARLPDAEYLAFATQFVSTASADLPSYPGLTAPILTAIGSARDDFGDSLDEHNIAQDTARAKTINKDQKRDALDALIKQAIALTKANSVTDASFAALGVPSAVTVDTPSATVPVGKVDTSERLRHTVNFTDAASPAIKRRPRGVIGCEIWVKIDGPPPGDEKDCTFLALDTATPYVAEYTPEQAGKTAHYLLRWQLRDGSRTAFGETVSATITA
jgi:hypothetical protein